MPIIVFIVTNAIVITSAYLFALQLYRKYSLPDFLISWFLLYLSQIILTELGLGCLNRLYLHNLVILNSTILIITYLFSLRKKAFLLRLEPMDTKSLIKNRILRLALAVILGFGLVKTSINLVNPPFGWDSLNYHFTFPVEWLKHGNLDMPITVFDDPSPSYYPINGSLFYLWLILPFKSVFLADLGQAPFFILSFIAVYSVSRKIGMDRDFSLLATALFLLTPNFFKQLEIAYVDVMVAGLFLAGAHTLFLLKEEFSYVNVLLFGISLGLLIGTKTIALAYGLILLLPFIYLSLKHIRKSYLLLFFIVPAVVLGGYSYLRNFLGTGNPFYPLDFNLFGKNIFKGVMDMPTYRAHFRIEDYSLGKLLFHEGLGVQTLLLILPAVFLALPTLILKDKKRLDFILGYFLIMPLLLYLVYRYIIPLANTRYLYPFLATGLISGFYTAYKLKIPVKIINFLSVICILASLSEISSHLELITSIIVAFLLFFSLPFIVSLKQLQLRYIAVLIIIALAFLEKDYLRNEYPRYIKMQDYSGFWPEAISAWNWLNKNTQNDNIAYAGRPVPFPLYGEKFKNNIYYVSVNKVEPVKLHYFPDAKYRWGYDFLSLHKSLEETGNYRSLADSSVWLTHILKKKTDYLFVYSLHQTKETEFPLEDKWAMSSPSNFKPVFSNETIHIYKVLK